MYMGLFRKEEPIISNAIDIEGVHLDTTIESFNFFQHSLIGDVVTRDRHKNTLIKVLIVLLLLSITLIGMLIHITIYGMTIRSTDQILRIQANSDYRGLISSVNYTALGNTGIIDNSISDLFRGYEIKSITTDGIGKSRVTYAVTPKTKFYADGIPDEDDIVSMICGIERGVRVVKEIYWEKAPVQINNGSMYDGFIYYENGEEPDIKVKNSRI